MQHNKIIKLVLFFIYLHFHPCRFLLINVNLRPIGLLTQLQNGTLMFPIQINKFLLQHVVIFQLVLLNRIIGSETTALTALNIQFLNSNSSNRLVFYTETPCCATALFMTGVLQGRLQLVTILSTNRYRYIFGMIKYIHIYIYVYL